jgi:uncharacterized protein with PIN domain
VTHRPRARGTAGDTGTATIRFYAELNDFLPADQRHRTLVHAFSERVSVKDAIESHGVPHVEVDLLLVNGGAVPFTYLLARGDRVAAYPCFRCLDVGGESRVRPPAPAAWRFVLDAHLGRLAAYLRMAGFDAWYRRDAEDENLARVSAEEGRILLTRDVGLLKRGVVRYGYYVRETAPRSQVLEVFRRFDLAGAARPFARCLRCNGLVRPVASSEVAARVPPRSRSHFTRFFRCTGCDRVYWEGSHYDWMRRFLDTLLADAGRDGAPPSR